MNGITLALLGLGFVLGSQAPATGYDITDALAGKSPSPRRELFYFNDDGSLVGLRYDQWKPSSAARREEARSRSGSASARRASAGVR